MKRVRFFSALMSVAVALSSVMGFATVSADESITNTGVSVSVSHGGTQKSFGVAGDTDDQEIHLSIPFTDSVELVDANADGKADTSDVLKDLTVKFGADDPYTMTASEVQSGMTEKKTYGKYVEAALSSDNKTLELTLHTGYSGISSGFHITVAGPSGNNLTSIKGTNGASVTWQDITVQNIPSGVTLTGSSQTVSDGETPASVTKKLSVENSIRGTVQFVLLKNGQPAVSFTGSNSKYLATDALSALSTSMVKNFSDANYTLTADENGNVTVTEITAAADDVLDLIVLAYPLTETEFPDTTDLETAITSASSVQTDAADASGLREALAKAKAVKTGASYSYYSQSDVDAQTSALNEILNHLDTSSTGSGSQSSGGQDDSQSGGTVPDSDEVATMTGYDFSTSNSGTGDTTTYSSPVKTDETPSTNEQTINLTVHFDHAITAENAAAVMKEFKMEYSYGATTTVSSITDIDNESKTLRYVDTAVGDDGTSLVFRVHLGYTSVGTATTLRLTAPDAITSVKDKASGQAVVWQSAHKTITWNVSNGVILEQVSRTVADPSNGVQASISVKVVAPQGSLIRQEQAFVVLFNGHDDYWSNDSHYAFSTSNYYGATFYAPDSTSVYSFDYLNATSESYAAMIQQGLESFLKRADASLAAAASSGNIDSTYDTSYYENNFTVTREGDTITLTEKNGTRGDVFDFFAGGGERSFSSESGLKADATSSDLTALKKAISKAGSVYPSRYTTASYHDMYDKLSVAKAMQSASGKYYLQSEIDAAATDLQNAVDALVPVSDTSTDTPSGGSGDSTQTEAAKVSGNYTVYTNHTGTAVNGTDDQYIVLDIPFDKTISLNDASGLLNLLSINIGGGGMTSGENNFVDLTKTTSASDMKVLSDGKTLELVMHVPFAVYAGELTISLKDDITTQLTTGSASGPAVTFPSIDIIVPNGIKLTSATYTKGTDTTPASVTKTVTIPSSATRAMVHLLLLKNGQPVGTLDQWGANVTAHFHNYLTMTDAQFASAIVADIMPQSIDSSGNLVTTQAFDGITATVSGATITITEDTAVAGDVLDLQIVGYGVVNTTAPASGSSGGGSTAGSSSTSSSSSGSSASDSSASSSSSGSSSSGSENNVTLTDDTNDVQVTAAPGVLPDDARISVAPVTSGSNFAAAQTALSDVAEQFTVYDISILSNSQTVEPDGTVTVSLPVPSGYDTGRLAVYRINDDGSREKMDGHVENGKYVFTTDHFSTYALVQTTAAASEDNASSGGTSSSAAAGTASDGTAAAGASSTSSAASSTADTSSISTSSAANPETGAGEDMMPIVVVVSSLFLSAAMVLALRRKPRRR